MAEGASQAGVDIRGGEQGGRLGPPPPFSEMLWGALWEFRT